jgi:hypothetical protein
MILVLWRQGPEDAGFLEWQDLLVTLVAFALPLRIVITGNAAKALDHPQMRQRLQQLAELDVQELLVWSDTIRALTAEPLLREIDSLTLAKLSGECRHLVHC